MGDRGYGGIKRKRAIFCPECGKRIPAASIYCEYCGKRLWEGGADFTAYYDDKRGTTFSAGRKHVFAAILALLLFLAVLCLMCCKNWSAEAKSVFYVKDNSVYGYRGAKKNDEPQEFTVQYFDKWSSRPSGGLLKGRAADDEDGMRLPGTDPAYSVSGRYFYCTELGIDDSFNLIRTDLKNGGLKTLDSGVVDFVPAGSDKVVYRKENGALYYYDGSKKNKIAAGTDYYRVNKEGDKLIWITDEDGITDIYCRQLFKKSEPVRLERNADLLDTAPDLSAVLVQKEDGVFKITSKGKTSKLAGDVSLAMQADTDTASFYFLKEEGTSEAYKELYYYSEGKARLADDNFKELIWQGGGALLYRREGEDGGCMLAAGGKTGELDREIAMTGQIQVEEGRLYFLSSEETVGKNGKPEHELCSVLLSEPQFQVTVVDRSVSEIACTSGESVYYFKDMGSDVGDLYRNGEWTAYDVAVGSVTDVPGGTGALCIADASSSGKRGTLTFIDGTDKKNIADNVRAYSAVSGTEIYILSDFSREKKRGDLLLFDGQGTELLEADIWGYFSAGNSGICR